MQTALRVPASSRPTECVRVPVMHQSWTSFTFVHWSYASKAIRPLVPPWLELDTYDGHAWVTLAAFSIEGVRPPGVPPIWPGTTPEVNVRTYVVGPDGRAGAYTLSLDIGSLPAALAGRYLFQLPYRWAHTDLVRSDEGVVSYRGHRRWGGPPARWDLSVTPGRAAPYDAGLATFLTGRWILFTRYGGTVAAIPTEHQPWPLVDARLDRCDQDLLEVAGVRESKRDPIVHFSAGVRARVGFPAPAGRLGTDEGTQITYAASSRHRTTSSSRSREPA
jgi:uncharacterized protein YqjF (DUF2071 family)